MNGGCVRLSRGRTAIVGDDMGQLERLEALFRERLGEWLDDQRERYVLDGDLVDMLEAAATKVLEKLPELTSLTDEPLAGNVEELDEPSVRATFEAFAEIWEEVEVEVEVEVEEEVEGGSEAGEVRS